MKRMSMPRTWPLPRKGKPRFILQPRGSKDNSIAVLAVIRDILKISKTRAETKKILSEGNVIINGKKIISDDFPVSLFDVISVPKIGKNFLMLIKGKRLCLKEINEKESSAKIFKIVGKKVLNKGRMQLNLSGGVNLMQDTKANVGDSVVVDLKSGKISKHLPLKEHAKVFITSGKNAGNEGIVSSVKSRDIEIKVNDIIVKIPSEKVWVIG
ncbi:MAG: hypothetical protein V1886_04250 [archaeon]